MHGQYREVRYAVPSYFPQNPAPEHACLVPSEVPVRSERAVGTTEDWPESQWVAAGLMPGAAFLRLYVLEED